MSETFHVNIDGDIIAIDLVDPLTASLVNQVQVASISAAEDADRAESAEANAVLAAATAPGVYLDTTAGVSAVAEGATFWVPQDGGLKLYRKVSGAPVDLDAFWPLLGSILALNNGQFRIDNDAIPLWIGTSNVNNSFDSSLIVSRDLGTLADNAHDITVSTQIADMNEFAYAPFDSRGNVKGGNGNHLAAYQSAWRWESPGRLTDYYGHFDVLLVDDGDVTRATAFYAAKPVLAGDGFVDQWRAVFVENIGEYSDPGAPTTATTNLAFQSTGSARFDHNGQARVRKLRIGNTDGSALEPFTFEIDGAGTTDGFLYVGQSGIWNWRFGMAKDVTDFIWKGNNTEAWRITAVTNHFLPGADGTQNFGSASKQVNNIYTVNAPIVSSDARLKTDIRDLTEAETAWAKAIKPVTYQLVAAVKDKGSKARRHTGVIAQQVYEAGLACGIADPLQYAFLCRDPLLELVKTPRTVMREAVKMVPFERPIVDIVDGVPVQKMTIAEEPVKVTNRVRVVDEAGNPAFAQGRPILEPVRTKRGRIVRDKNGRPKMVQSTDEAGNPLFEQIELYHDVPVMEPVQEMHVEQVRALDADGHPDWQWSIRYEELAIFLVAAWTARKPRIAAA